MVWAPEKKGYKCDRNYDRKTEVNWRNLDKVGICIRAKDMEFG